MKDFPWAKTDCRHYLGEKPCAKKRDGCGDCPEFDPMGTRILIIKLAAMGDVLRTTPLVAAIRARHERAHVTWLVDPPTAPLLKGVPGIDRVVAFDETQPLFLKAQEFDELFCLDKEPRATALSALVRSKLKKGFTLTPHGTLGVHDDDAAYALRLGLDDPLKFFENEKTYQEIVFEACNLSFKDEPVLIGITDEEREKGRAFLETLGPGPFVGINTGAGNVFATKRLSVEKTAALARLIRQKTGLFPVLLGGAEEKERNREILARAAGDVLDAGTDHTIRGFASIVSALSALVCVDTLAMHLAVAEKVPVAAIFGPTCHQEVHLYGRGEKLVQAPWCAPCYKRECVHHTCMEEVQVEDVLELLQKLELPAPD